LRDGLGSFRVTDLESLPRAAHERLNGGERRPDRVARDVQRVRKMPESMCEDMRLADDALPNAWETFRGTCRSVSWLAPERSADGPRCACVDRLYVLRDGDFETTIHRRARGLPNGGLLLIARRVEHRIAVLDRKSVPPARILCAEFSADLRDLCPLLPDVLTVTQSELMQHPGIAALIEALHETASAEMDTGSTERETGSAEVRSCRAGASELVRRFAELTLVALLQKHRSEDRAHVKSAQTDPQIASAVREIEGHPAKPWTVRELAQRAGMSRSAFAARFQKLVGRSPLNFVKEQRLQQAVTLLRETALSIKQIAFRVGYESAAGFSTAFRGRFGMSPVALRANPTGAQTGRAT